MNHESVVDAIRNVLGKFTYISHEAKQHKFDQYTSIDVEIDFEKKTGSPV
jgi:hypothetical protein